MPTAAEINGYLANLYRALGSGQLTVVIGEQSVTYRSVNDIKKAIAEFTAMLEALEEEGKVSSGHKAVAVAGRRTL